MSKARHYSEARNERPTPRPSTTSLTVASLGSRVRLIPVAPDRDRQIADLIASCETLRSEWECLFQRIIAHLNDGCEQPHDENSSASHSRRWRR
jgi:hypothetical protein